MEGSQEISMLDVLSARYYSRQFFRIKRDSPIDSFHFQGGPAQHVGAQSPRSDRPFQLILDIDCKDPAIFKLGLKLFNSSSRLPLYYQWTEAPDLAYQVVDDDNIKLITYEALYVQPNWPYANYPLCYDRRPISLEPIPVEIAEAMMEISEVDESLIEQPLIDSVEAWLELSFQGQGDEWPDLFGGLAYPVQGFEPMQCPNMECSLNKNWKPQEWDASMKFLAMIQDDATQGLPMCDEHNWTGVQLIFRICRECLTIHVEQQCD